MNIKCMETAYEEILTAYPSLKVNLARQKEGIELSLLKITSIN